MLGTIRPRLPERLVMHLQAIDHYLHGEAELRLLSKLCDRERDAVDAGANIGTYSYFMRRHVRNVYAYEPNPQLAARLARLMPGIVVRGVALSDTSSEVRLKIPVNSAGRQLHELASVGQEFEGPVQVVPVSAITLDSENLYNVGFIKVDVEQHERQVLRGAMTTIKRCRPVVMTECTPLKYDDVLPNVFAFLTDEGYVGWFRFGGEWQPLSRLNPEKHTNGANFGTDRFIANNLIFIPAECQASKRPDLPLFKRAT